MEYIKKRGITDELSTGLKLTILREMEDQVVDPIGYKIRNANRLRHAIADYL